MGSSRLTQLPGLVLAACCALACTETSVADEEAGTTSETGSSEDSGSEGTDTLAETDTDTNTDTDTDTGGPACGNGIVEDFELCDDGNAIDDDGCSNACVPPSCSEGPIWIDRAEELELSGNSFAAAPVVVRDDGSLVSAHEVNGDPGIDIYLRAFSPTGEVLWEQPHSFGDFRDRAWALLANAEGDVFVGGSIDATTAPRALLSRHSGADGSLLWSVDYDGMALGGSDRVVDLAFDEQGQIVALVELADVEDDQDVFVKIFDPADGSELWSTSWSGEPGTHGLSNDSATDLELDPVDGRYFVMANRDAGPGGWVEPTVLVFEPPTPDPLFSYELSPDRGPDDERGLDLSFAAGGELFFKLATEIDGEDALVIQGFDPNTAILWSRSTPDYGMRDSVYSPYELLALPDGAVMMAGWGWLTQRYQVGFSLVLEANGVLRCLDVVDPATLPDWRAGTPLVTSTATNAEGMVYVSGYSFSGGFAPYVGAWPAP